MPAQWTEALIAAIRDQAIQAGFTLAGVAAAPAAQDPEGTQTAERFSEWIADGRAGEMDYLKRRDEQGDLLRQSARTAIPWARSVVVCAFNYNLDGPKSLDAAAPDRAWIGRYAWLGTPTGGSADYHDDLLTRLRKVEAALQSLTPCQTKAYVDTGPLLERDFAARAGIGWTGKKHLHPQPAAGLLAPARRPRHLA